MFDLAFGTGVLIVGLEDQPDGWLKVYIGARWKNIYCAVTDATDQQRIKSAWAAGGHVTMTLTSPLTARVLSDG